MTSSVYFPAATHLFEMKGHDARDFLHRLTTANIRDLQPGDFRPGFFLNPQGKTRAVFRVACRAPTSFYLEIEGGKDDHWKDAFLTVVDQFTFTEKYELQELKGLANAWIFGLPQATENHLEERLHNGKTLILLNGSKKPFSTHWSSVWAPPVEVDHFVTAVASLRLEEKEFEQARIHALFPRLDRELVLDANPLEIGMREAIADNKGCYPGQEVIEKIVSLGSPAKRLSLLTGTGPLPAPGAPLRTEEGVEVGVVTSSCRDENEGFSALALLRKNAAAEGKKLRVFGPHAGEGIEVNVERVTDYE